jgi:Xaa-Pro aminopeptidase
MTFDIKEKSPHPVTSEPSAKQTGYDTAPPPALVSFMLKHWKAGPSKPAALKHREAFFERRRALSKLFPGETLVIPTGHEKVRANDTYYRFRPGSDFFYLTGNLEPDCVLLMQPQEGGGHRDVLFVEPNPGRSDATFYTDRNKGELWVGPRLGVEQSRIRFGLHEARGLPELAPALSSLRGPATHRWRMLRGISEKLDSSLPGRSERDRQLAVALSELRLIKEPLEIRELSAAIASTKRGFEDVIRALKGARSEREVEGVFNLRARTEGNDVGYNVIAASGAHACILHWTRNDGRIRPGALLLLDAGIEGNALYTADVTRTLPVGGRFSREQREIYSLVLQAQAAAFKAVKPGNDFMEPNQRAMQVLAEGLERLRILPSSAEEAQKDENQFYKRYSLHNVSHMLGLDVHDCAQARQEAYKYGKLQPGMVLTVEPGLYFQTDDLTVPARYRGIGVRIEDDVVVTEKGYRNLTGAFPSSPEEVEAWMSRIWKSKRSAFP